MIRSWHFSWFFILCMAVVLMKPSYAFAQGEEAAPQPLQLEDRESSVAGFLSTSVAPPGTVLLSEDATHEPLRLTPDKTAILELDSDMGQIIIGNEAHLQVLPSGLRRILVVGQQPGATFFTITSPTGEIIMQRHAIVASPQSDYIRVRRSCGGSEGCNELTVYYCPDMCHEVALPNRASGGGVSGLPALPFSPVDFSAGTVPVSDDEPPEQELP